jgi:hypothetical protein
MVKNMFKWFFTGMGVVALIAVSSSCGPLYGGTDVDERVYENQGTTVTTFPPGVTDPFGAPQSPPEPPQSAPEAVPEPTPAAPAPAQPEAPQGGAAVTARQQLGALSVNDDFSKQPDYDRKKFKHWSDLDGNRCDARQDVLIRQSIGGKAQIDPFGCTVIAGDWFSEYDGITTTVPGDFDIDHVVALGEGWRAGAWQWDDKKRERFANDLDSRQLIAVSATSNRSKSDKRPDQWMPPRKEFRCQYLFDWVSVKHLWELTVTTSEKTFIGRELETC